MPFENSFSLLNAKTASINDVEAGIQNDVASINEKIAEIRELVARSKAAAEAAEANAGVNPPSEDGYFPYIGEENYWFHPDSTRVTYANRATLQSVIDSPQVKYIRLDGRDYDLDITVPSDKVIVGIPGKTKLKSKTLAFNASRLVIKGVEGPVIVPANSGMHEHCVTGVAPNSSLLSQGSMRNSMTLRTFRSSIILDNSISGAHYNMRLINPHWQGGAAGYETRPGIELTGRPDGSSHTQVMCAINALTPRSSTIKIKNVASVSIAHCSMERGPEHFTDNKSVVDLQDCGTIRLMAFDGYDPANVMLDAQRVANLQVNNFGANTGGALKFKFRNVDSLRFLASVDDDRLTDDGLPGTSAKPRFRINNKDEPNGVTFNGANYNAHGAKLTGADIAAATRLALDDDGFQYRRWAMIKERAVSDLLGPNWKSIAATKSDNTAELQALVDASGENSVIEIPANKIYYNSGSISMPMNSVLVGNGQGNCGIVMKNQNVPMFTYNFSQEAGFSVIDMTMQGGKSWIEGTQAGRQFTEGWFLYSTVRDQAEAAIDLKYTYGWDNLYAEGCNFVRCGTFVRTLGRTGGTSGVPGESPEMCYMDKFYLMRCQIIEGGRVFDLNGVRPSGGFMIMDTGMFRCTQAITNSNNILNSLAFCNSLIKDCSVSEGPRTLFQNQSDPGFSYVGVTIENPNCAYLFNPNGRYEGIKLVKGGFTGKAFTPLPAADPRSRYSVTLENCDFGYVPSGISLDTTSGTPVHSSYTMINTRFAAPEDAAWNQLIGIASYETAGTPGSSDDSFSVMPGWCPGMPIPSTKILRDRVVA